MKIAFLTPEYISESRNWHGGLANYLSRITHGLIERGHEIYLFTCSDQQEIIYQDGIILHRIWTNDFLLFIFNKITLGLLRNIMQIIFIAYYFKKYFIAINKKEKFDIIHSASCQTPALFLDSKELGAPIVTRLSSITRLCQIISGRRNLLDMYLLNLAEKRLTRKSDKVFAPSIMIQKNAFKEFGLQVDFMEPPEYFTDWEDDEMDFSFYNQYYQGKKYVLYYGTLSRLKGAEFIAEIIYDFLNTYKNYYFAIIGKMESLKKGLLPIEPILKKAREHKSRIIYTNSLRHKLLLPIIKNAQAIFLPLKFDNLPNTLIESMSLGKIVIGTWDSGFDQLIADGKNGFLLNYGDKNKLREILKIVCTADGQELVNIEKAARETVRNRLNFNSKILELEKYYETAIKEYREKHNLT